MVLCQFPFSLPVISAWFFFFVFNDTATTKIYTLSLHDALPIFEDQPFADHARKLVDKLSTKSEPITRELHKSRMGFLNRLRWTLSYFVVNSIDYTVTRRLNFGVRK